MMLTVNRCVKEGVQDFWMIHDSFGTTAKSAATLSRNIREEYYAMFNNNDVLEQFRTAMLQVIPDVAKAPARGNLDLEGVKNSKYFFS